MKKFAKVLSLALMLALALTGCNLIEVDAKMQADEDIAKLEKAYSATVAAYKDGEVTVAEVIGDFNTAYNEVNYMYQYYYGMQMTHEDVDMLIENVLEQRVRTEIVSARFDDGNELSAEKIAEVEEEVAANAASAQESAIDLAEGKTDAAKAENARVLLREAGMDYDSLYNSAIASAKVEAMEAILRDEVAELSDDALQAAFDAKVAEQKESYVDGRSFENAMSSSASMICWKPDGYRAVKHILVKPADEILQAYKDAVSELEANASDIEALEAELETANDGEEAEGERGAEEIQKELDAVKAGTATMEKAVADAAQACLNDVKATTDAIYAKLEAGEDFEALIEEYSEDPGSQSEQIKEHGYAVSAASEIWEVNFRDAAMALAQVGDYTAEPVVSGSGVHIITYSADIRGGEVEMSDVREALYAETLEDAKAAHCDEVINGWLEEAGATYDAETFEAVLSEER